MIQFLR